MKRAVVLVLLLSACAAGTQRSRWPSQADGDRFSDIIRKNAESATYCPSVAEGEICLMNWDKAMEFCRNRVRKSHLPTARDYVNRLRNSGVKVLEEAQVKDKPPMGYYLVDCKNPDGKLEAFYMNHSEYVRPEGETGNHLLWTSSIPPKHPLYAHVFYDEWGGGGGDPAHHKLTQANALQCVED